MEQKLSAREQLFCYFHAMLGNAAEAAVQAGYSPKKAAVKAARLMKREDIQAECARLAGQRLPEAARRGLERLAFGKANDAVRLLFWEDPNPEEIAGLDLFLLSEVKRPKGGGLEMKFQDRAAALKLLLELGDTSAREPGVESLLSALDRSAQCLGSGDRNED